MTRGTPFLVLDALGRSLARPVPLLLGAVAVAAALLSGMGLLLLPAARGAGGGGTEGYLLAELGAAPSEAAIARLGSEVWTWPGVDGVAFRFPGETDPAPVAARTLVVRLLTPEARSGLEARLRALPEVVRVRYVQRAARAQVPWISRVVALVLLVGTLALALGLGYRAVAGAMGLWGRELALLRSCGASPAQRRAPFFVLGGLVGLLGGALYLGACWALWRWGALLPYLRDAVPRFPQVWGGLLLWGLAGGVGLGLLGALIATVAPRSHS
ncbi:MAG: hypothetical protein N2320_05985 [Candidatus Bipolaricaulota bacterium]|nr:hypothetical protein [Candidatus Bipolaricaulota bacterium]